MNRNADISDEMIARYLSGKASPEEEAAVLDYLAESDERLDDILAMSAAAEINREEKQMHHIRPLWPTLSIAASVILFLCIGLPFLQQSPTGNNIGVDHAPSYTTTDTMIDIEMEDGL